MGLDKLNYLYQAVVLDHANHPHHYGTLEKATQQITMHNPTCGDTLDLTLQVENNQIIDFNFTGQGCSISQASASMLGDVLIGQSVQQAQTLIQSFLQLTMDQPINEKDQAELKEAAILGAVAQFPTRIKCATLAWHGAEKLLDEGKRI